MKYQQKRGLVDQGDRKIWAFLGDGECDEPESLGSISLAGREKLDNLIFVVNCNLQRLDGPVRGNGKIVQELEGVFRGAGWNVIKVLWGRHWDALFEKDKTGLLQKLMDEVVDGELQNCKNMGGAYTREKFFGKYPELLKLVEDLSDDDISELNRGGHDPYKVYAAYWEAVNNNSGKPTVILAQTVKGYGMGASGEATNDTHSVKKLDEESLHHFRDKFDIPLTDEELESIPYYRPPEDSPEMEYMRERRAKLGGALPARRRQTDHFPAPPLSDFEPVLAGSGERAISTTMAFVRLLSILVKDQTLVTALCRLCRMKRAHLVWKACFDSSVFIRRSGKNIRLLMPTRCCTTRNPNRDKSWKKVSTRPARCRHGLHVQHPTARTTAHWYRSIFFIPCSVSSASVTSHGRQVIPARVDS
jgi:pyruvate dehydrogenase E1 component